MSAERMPISRGVTRLAYIPDGERRDGGPELVIRGEHPVIAMPVLPRRRHEGSEPVEELKWGKLDDAADARPRGLPPAPRANPVGRLVSREHVADAGDAAAPVTGYRESLERKRRPGAIPQQVLTSQRMIRPGSTAGRSTWSSASS